jgi:hypothetical protein
MSENLDKLPPSDEDKNRKPERVRRTSGRGSCSHLGSISEQHAKEKQEEIAREEQKWR